jgi:hypothetical protein
MIVILPQDAVDLERLEYFLAESIHIVVVVDTVMVDDDVLPTYRKSIH